MLKSLTILLVFKNFVYAAQRTCVGNHLLPINDGNFSISKRNLRSLGKYIFAVAPTAASLQNNGKTVIIELKYGKSKPYINEGPYGDENYIFDFMYFNWLKKEYITKETIQLELHIVFVNTKYETFELAVEKNFGLTVWSFKYNNEFSKRPSELTDDDFETLKLIRQPNAKANMSSPQKEIPSLYDMINVFNFYQEYYVYLGGVISNIHPCSGSGDVIWLEFSTFPKICAKNFAIIKTLLSFNNASLMEQFHDSKPTNGPIYQSIENNMNFDADLFNATSADVEETTSGTEDGSMLSTLILMIFIVVLS